MSLTWVHQVMVKNLNLETSEQIPSLVLHLERREADWPQPLGPWQSYFPGSCASAAPVGGSTASSVRTLARLPHLSSLPSPSRRQTSWPPDPPARSVKKATQGMSPGRLLQAQALQ